MYTKEMIMEQLTQMGAPRDSVVTVHSSLRAVGETEGRGEGLLDALIGYFTSRGGLLMIPTHTWANFFDHRELSLDMTDPHTCIGTLPDIAAGRVDAHRSLHPTHSVAVFGDPARAEAFIAGDGETDTCTSPDGCYGKLCDERGSVLLIGVGHNRNTYLHCVEEMLGVPNRTDPRLTALRVKTKDGSVYETLLHLMKAEGIGDVSKHFPKLEPAFRYHGCISDGYVGNAASMLCDAAGMKNVMRLIMERGCGRELLADDEPLDRSLYEN